MKQTIKASEFIVIMIAAAIITTALYQTNQPPSRMGKAGNVVLATPRMAMQYSTNAQYEAPPKYPSPWITPTGSFGDSWSHFWGGAWASLSGMFFGHPVTDY